MPRIVVYHPGRLSGRPSLRERLALALGGVLAVAVLTAFLVVSFLLAIPLVAILLVYAGRLIWRLRAEVRRARHGA